MRERTTPISSPAEVYVGEISSHSVVSASATHRICQFRNQIPPRTAPMRDMTFGASQVAESSKMVDVVRRRPIEVDVKPVLRR